MASILIHLNPSSQQQNTKKSFETQFSCSSVKLALDRTDERKKAAAAHTHTPGQKSSTIIESGLNEAKYIQLRFNYSKA